MTSTSLSDFQRFAAHKAVALPKTEEDIRKLVRFARRHGTPLITKEWRLGNRGRKWAPHTCSGRDSPINPRFEMLSLGSCGSYVPGHFGRNIYALGRHREAAFFSGIDIKLQPLFRFGGCSFHSRRGETRSRAEFRIYQLVVMGSLIIAAVSIDRLMGQAK